MGSLVNWLVDQDIYGHKFGIKYKGSDTYKTKLGALFTLATYVLMLVNIVTLCTKFANNSRQEEKSNELYLDRFSAGRFDLKDYQFEMVLLNFSFQPLTDDIGRFRVYQNTNCKNSMVECILDGSD